MNSINNIKKEVNKMLIIKIRSIYLLKLIFKRLEKKKLLDLLKYNNNIKKRINLNIIDYQKYYGLIDIEIKPANNKYGKFINIKKEDELYYHIYFNNSKEEIERNYINKDEQVNKIKILIDYQITTFKELFYNCNCIESICFKKFNRNDIYNMNGLFCSCSSLKELNFNNFNTNNVTDMSFMFDGCSSLKELNVSNFDTKNVTDMSFMLSRCSSLKKLNLNNFNTNNVTNMRYMFYECSSLKELNLNNFSTNSVTNMRGMFYECLSLKELNLSNFNTNKVYDMNYMFFGCSNELIKKIKNQYKNIKEEAF